MRITLIGANGFVGTGLKLFLAAQPDVHLLSVTRDNYDSAKGTRADITIDTSGNSKKFLSDREPKTDLDLTVAHRLRTLLDFPADLHIHISSVDVYSNLTSPETTRESTPADLLSVSNYGLHKLLAEQIVQHYAGNWLILRLAGMVGPSLRKNPVFDILNDQPLRIHPDSEYQFMHTSEVARILWNLIQSSAQKEIFNLCGDGLVSPRKIAALAAKPLNLTLLPADVSPRIVNVSIDKIKRFSRMPSTIETMTNFLRQSATIP